MASRTRGTRGGAAAAPAGRRSDRLLALRESRLVRAMIAHEHRTAAGLFALLVLVYLYPALIEGHLLAPLTGLYMNATTPWAGRAPADVFNYVNTGLEDVPLSYYPWDVLARQLLHAGTFPAWNPYALGGTPFFANPEVAWLSPFSLPLWILPLHYGLGVAAALKLWVAGFGTYLLARELRLGFWAGMLAGVSFALCAFDIAWLSHGVQVSVAVMLPWSLWLTERLIRRGRAAEALGLTAVVVVVLTGGHPGTQLHVLAATILYALMRAGLSADVASRERLRRLGLVGAGVLLGALVTAVVLLPAQQASLGSAGAYARSHGATEFLGSNMPVGILRTALFPEWWGRLSELILAGPAYFNERTLYAGTGALVLAVLALVAGGGAWRRMAPFAVLGAIGAAVAVKNPLHALVRGLPLFEQVQNQRMLLWFLLGVAVLAGFGLQAVLDGPRWGRVWGVVGAAVLAAVVALATIDPHGATLGQVLHYWLHRSAEGPFSILAYASVLWWLTFVAALAVVLALAWRRPQAGPWIGALVVLVAALDMLHFAHSYQPMGPVSKAIPPRTPAIAYLERHAGDGRIAGLGKALPADWPTIYRLRDAAGYDQPQPSLRFFRLWKTMEPEQTAGGPFRFEAISPQSLRMLSLLGTRYVITGREGRSSSAAFPRVYHGSDAAIFANKAAVERAFVAGHVQVAAEDDEEIGAVMADSFDPRSDAVVRADELGSSAPPSSPNGGSVRVTGEGNSEVTLHATLPARGLIVLDDAIASGWSVRVDGRPARALQTDVVLRGVVVPAGTHEVVWSYRVPGLRLGAVLSLVGLLIALGWGGWLVVRKRRGGGRAGR